MPPRNQPTESNETLAPEKYIRKVTWIGMLGNTLLTALKFYAGIAGTSQALVADAVHSLSDSVTDIAVITGSHFWSRPPDACHPHGHKRVETLITIGIGTVLLMVGIGVGYQAVHTLHHQTLPHPGWIALAAAAISLVAKEVLYRWTNAAGKRVRSTALVANAWHHRLDALSSIPAFLAVGGAILLPNWTFLDRIGALVVSIFIVQAAVKLLWPQIQEILEAGAPPATLKRIRRLAESQDGVVQIHNLRTRYVGADLHLDLHLVVDGRISVREGHAIAETVKSHLLAELNDLRDAVIHVEPDGPQGEA